MSLSNKQLAKETKHVSEIPCSAKLPSAPVFPTDGDDTQFEQKTQPAANSQNAVKTDSTRKRKKGSRWDEKPEKATSLGSVSLPSSTNVVDQTTELRQFDSMSEDDFKKQILASQIAAKALAKLAKPGPSNEYDSDEDTEGGTFEHKRRMNEMQKTYERAKLLTERSEGKHHLADFLPDDEKEKFFAALAKARQLAGGSGSDTSPLNEQNEDYAENKLQADNIGFKLLQKMGWSGKGLGANEQGVQAPVNKGKAPNDTQGFGANSTEDDNIFDVYRKRMMLAYKFRPNPLNNPRRPYY